MEAIRNIKSNIEDKIMEMVMKSHESHSSLSDFANGAERSYLRLIPNPLRTEGIKDLINYFDSKYNRSKSYVAGQVAGHGAQLFLVGSIIYGLMK